MVGLLGLLRMLPAFLYGEGLAEEAEERGLAGVSGADNEDAIDRNMLAMHKETEGAAGVCSAGSCICITTKITTYLNGVGSFLLRTRLGELTVLTALLA